MRNLRRDKQWTGLIDRLIEEKDPETGQSAFPSLRELMCFAAGLGYEQSRREPLGEDWVDFVEGRVFPRSDVALDLLYLIALAAERRVEVIDEEHEDQAVQIFEEYANGGLSVLNNWLNAHAPDESPIRSLMTDLRRCGFLKGDESHDGAPEDVIFAALSKMDG
jgi:dnd system-associated protein 4